MCRGPTVKDDGTEVIARKIQGRVPRDSRFGLKVTYHISLRSGEIVVPIGIDKREYY